MSSAPPPGPEDEPGLEAPADVDALVAAAVPASAEAELALYEQELASGGKSQQDIQRSARLLHEMACLRERQLGNAREAGRLYTQSLTADPTLLPNTWALYRLFSARGAWDNLLRLLEAEIRFAPLPTARDRADVMVEKGRLLEDRLARPDEARAAYRAALQTDPGHPAALLALLLAALDARARGEDVRDEVTTSLMGLAKLAEEPRLRALFVIELARSERGPLGPHKGDPDRGASQREGQPEGKSDGKPEGEPQRVRRAADLLFKALLEGAAEEPIGEELDRLSLAAGDPELRSRVLDLFDSRVARDESGASQRGDAAFLVALHREKARVLQKRGARDAALAVLERGLRFAPGHPLLVADLLDVAEEAGRADAIARLLDGGALREGSYRYQEALLRRAEAASRVGAFGEAALSLDQIPADSSLAPLARLARTRLMARLGDGEGLSQLFVEEADRLAAPANEAPGEAAPAASPARAPVAEEAAHLYTRAAVIRAEHLDDVPGAETLLRRALEVRPDHAAAKETLRGLLAGQGQFAELAGLYERELALVPGTDGDRLDESAQARRRSLQQSLHLIYRDLLGDGESARRLEQQLGGSGDELESLVRGADEAGERFVQKGEGAEELIRQLRTLSERAGSGEVAAGLRLLAADVAAQAGAERASLALTEEAFRCDPRSPAAAELEARYRESGRSEEALKVLGGELAAWEAAPDGQPADGGSGASAGSVVTALRFRAALVAMEASKPDEALALLEPLRRALEVPAVLLSWDLAREAGRPELEAALLEEPAVTEVLAGRSPLGAAARLLALGEALEAGGDRGRAAEMFRRCLDEAGEGSAEALRAQAALGLYRTQARDAEDGPATEAFLRLARTVGNLPGSEPLAREAALLALAGGEGESDAGAGDAPTDDPLGEEAGPVPAVARWMRGVRARESGAAVEALGELAREAGPAAAELRAILGVRELLSGQAEALGPLGESVVGAGVARRLVEVAATDLGGETRLPRSLFALRRTRAERLASGGGAAAALAENLFTEEALELERAGRLGDAAASQVRALGLGAELEATEGLRRLAQAAGRRRAEAAALVRLGGLLADPSRAAERFAEAGLIFEEEGLPEDAAAAFLEVLRRVPEDDEAFRRLADLVEKRGEVEALEGLYTFKLGRVADPVARANLHAQRAALRAGALGRRREAIHDHRRVLELVPDRRESLVFLAQRALEADRFAVAIPFYERALELDGEAPDATGLRLELSRAYERAHRPADALAVLRAAVDAHPDDPVPRERVIALGTRRRDHALVAGELQALRALTPDPGAKAALALRLGRLERDQRGDRGRALAAFRAALELDPLGGAARELLATVAGGPLAPEEAAAANEVIGRLRAGLITNPFQPRSLECLRDLAELRGLIDLRDVAAQLETVLGTGSFRGRARELTRSVALTSLGALGSPGDPPSIKLLFEIWPHLAEGVARLFPGEAADLGINRHSRVAAGSEPRLVWAEAASVAVGLPSLSIHVAGLEELTVVAFDLPESSLVLGRGVLGGDPSSRFRVGRALALLRLRATALERMTPNDLQLVWTAAAYLAGVRDEHRLAALAQAPGVTLDLPSIKVAAKRLHKGLSRREVKSLETYLDVFAREVLDVPGFAQALRRSANRFGLLVGGDLPSALKAVADAPQLREQELRSPACRDLIEFALGDRYLAVRREAGLSRD